MRARIGIVAALPREISALVKGLAADASLKDSKIFRFERAGAVIVAAGMGAVRAALAVEACGAVDALISVGLAGSCSVALKPGTAGEAHLVIDTQTGERFYGATQTDLVLATTPAIASVGEKRRLAATYGAELVDMEAATVARLARARKVPFRAIKAVSDAHDFELEGLSKFSTPDGQFRTGAFAVHTALRPWMWSKAASLGRDSARALEALTAKLEQVIAGA